jgi:hypothetical protein
LETDSKQKLYSMLMPRKAIERTAANQRFHRTAGFAVRAVKRRAVRSPPGREVQHRAARVLHRGLLENGSAGLPVTSGHAELPALRSC